MRSKPSTFPDKAFPQHDQLDAALRSYSQAVPSSGFESRISARLAAGIASDRRPGLLRYPVLRWVSTAALGAAAAGAIVFATVQHSQHNRLPPVALRSPLPDRSAEKGISAASAAHVPGRATPQTATIDPRSPRTPARGRATLSTVPARHGGGMVVPPSPYPPESTEPRSADPPQP